MSDLPYSQPTHHALLIAWGHFAQSLRLVDHFHAVPIPQKTVHHTPPAKLVTLLLGLLAGNEYLADLSLGPTPLSRDPAVAAAWGLPALASASGVSRTLAAMTPASFQALQTVLTQLSAPFVHQALADLRSRDQPIQLDVDLTGRPVSSTSTVYPGAAFGYMDQEVRLGYQIAQVCVQTPRWGRQWLVAQHHPGDTVSAPCLLDLLAAAETQLGCHPARRPDLVATRLVTLQARLAILEQQAHTLQARFATCLATRATVQTTLQRLRRRVLLLTDRSGAGLPRDPTGALTRTTQQLRRSAARVEGLTTRLTALRTHQRQVQQRQQQLRARLPPLQQRAATLCAENTAQPNAPRIRLRMDAGFCSGANLTAVLELGYEVETKASHPAVLATLRERIDPTTSWVRVGKNAAMVVWPDYQVRGCPYPLTVGLERFQIGAEEKYAVLLHSQEPGRAVPEAQEWFSSYNARQTIEAGFKQEKSVFKLQHLWSRQAIGMQVQVALTLFAANFLRWAQEWLQERTTVTSSSAARALQRPKQLVRVGANSPAVVEHEDGQVRVRFSSFSGLAGMVIQLRGAAPVQLPLNLYERVPF